MDNPSLIITPIDNQPLIKVARNLPNIGVIKNYNDFVYLAIDDGYIHSLFPLLNDKEVEKPDYFSIGIGTHISVIYPDEMKNPQIELDRQIDFQIVELLKAETIDAIYYVLRVSSPELIQIRKMNNLGEKLNLNGYIIDLHTTIGKKSKGLSNESI